jgi:hypothetical protein
MSYLRNHKLLLLIISVLLLANIGLLYFFVFNRPHRPHRMTEAEIKKMALQRVKNEVGLDDRQLALYDSLRTGQIKNMKPLFEELAKSKEEFFKLLYQQNVSDSVISQYAEIIGEKQEAIDMTTYLYFQSLKQICTPEQQAKMDSFIQQIVKRIISGRHGQGTGKGK